VMRRRPDCEKEWQQANRRAGASEPATPNRKSPTAKKVFVKAQETGRTEDGLIGNCL
jgi:hypothetical protein